MQRTNISPREIGNSSIKNTQGHKYLTFFIDQVSYGVSILQIKEIICGQMITPIPDAVNYIKGIINLRGAVIPVIDLRLRMHKPELQLAQYSIIVVEHSINERVLLTGLIVDKVNAVSAIADSSIEHPQLPECKKQKNYIIGIAKEDKYETIILDVNYLITTEESLSFEELGLQS